MFVEHWHALGIYWANITPINYATTDARVLHEKFHSKSNFFCREPDHQHRMPGMGEEYRIQFN